jgi:diamine N-acetyltransferase
MPPARGLEKTPPTPTRSSQSFGIIVRNSILCRCFDFQSEPAPKQRLTHQPVIVGGAGVRYHTIIVIREASSNDIATIARLVSESNKDVAAKFSLTIFNCPKHPSFCTDAWVMADLARGERYFILEEGLAPIGCVAYENPSAGLAYLNRLSVLPAHRNRGIGACLVQYIIQLAQSASIQTISIGVIGEHGDLQRWYRKLGFKDKEIKRFPHLPFSVKYMSYALQGG